MSVTFTTWSYRSCFALQMPNGLTQMRCLYDSVPSPAVILKCTSTTWLYWLLYRRVSRCTDSTFCIHRQKKKKCDVHVRSCLFYCLLLHVESFYHDKNILRLYPAFPSYRQDYVYHNWVLAINLLIVKFNIRARIYRTDNIIITQAFQNFITKINNLFIICESGIKIINSK